MSTPLTEIEKPKPVSPCTIKSQTHLIADDPRKSNRIMARIIPPILVVIAAFSCYVWYYMCYSWYIRNKHTGTGICLIIFQILLLILMASTFFRILLTPAGYIPNRADLLAFDSGRSTGDSTSHFDRGESPKAYGRPPSHAEIERYRASKSLSSAPIFMARTDASSYTRYCTICEIPKYDRAHHCSEVNRCVKKLDHFCPWVGGAVGHTRYKFFVQFITYVALYCILLLVVLIIAVVQRRNALRRGPGSVYIPAYPGLWYSGIALCAFFGCMMVPFSLFHIYQVCVNQTTIESIEIRPVQLMVSKKRESTDEHMIDTHQRITLSSSANPFDLGLWHNLQQVFGIVIMDRWVLLRLLSWFVPLHGSPGDGLFFPYDQRLLGEVEHQAETAAKQAYR